MGKILKNGIAYAGGGAEGKSAYQTWLDLGNEGTEQDFLDSLGGGGSSLYVVTGSLDMENEDNPVILNQTFEEVKAAYDDGKTIIADILAAGEAQYIFNLLYVLEDAIAFEWINSAAKTGGQINLMSDNTVSFTMTNFESGGESYDDTEIRELVNGKQDATIFIDATMSTVKDSWDNYLLDVDEEYRYSKVQDMLVDGKTVVLRVKIDNVLVELPCVSYESYTNATLTFAAPYYNSSTEEKGLYIAFCASTVGWKLGIKVVKEASSTDMSPFIIKSVYTEDSDGFTVDTKTTTPALWNDWYPAFEAGRPVYWDLHKNSIDSNTDVIRLYPHSHGVYYEATGTKECQFIGIGGYPGYDSRNDTTKYYYIGWFRSGSAPASNYKFVKRYKIDEIPKGGTTGQVLAKKSNTNGDVEWIDMTAGGSLVVTGNYSTDDDDNWTVSNIDKTFAEINEAITNNQNVVLKIYPEGDTTNPYILYPAMHYANMGTAFSLMVSDTGQISGLSVMITADNQVVATRNEYDFEALKKSVSDGKTLVAGAITGKGVQTATDDEFATMAENIGKIPSAPCGTVWEETDYVMGTGYININIAYGNKIFVASHSSRLHYSEDGIHWHLGLDRSLENSNANDSIKVSYYEDKKIWVAYDSINSYDNPQHIYYSYDGKTWVKATSSALYFNYFKYHNGIFVAYHTEPNYTSGTIYYSTDGKTWNSTTYFPSSEKCRFYIECANGFWYVSAVDKNSSRRLYRTTNFTGFNLVSGYQELANASLYYIEGIYFAKLFKDDVTSQYSYSTDGINWYAITMEFTGKTMYGTSFMDCVFFNGRYIASTYAGIISGTLGSTWTQPENMLSTGYTLCQIKDRLFAYTRSGPSTTNPGIFYTDDGINWTKAEGSPTHNLETNIQIYECNGKLYINSSYSNSGINYPVYMSNDNGASWSIISEGFNILGYYDGIYLAKSYKYSFDLETWNDTNITDPSVKTISYVAYGNGILVGCGQGGIKCTYFSPFVKREE